MENFGCWYSFKRRLGWVISLEVRITKINIAESEDRLQWNDVAGDLPLEQAKQLEVQYLFIRATGTLQ
jgi:hypothetical protein